MIFKLAEAAERSWRRLDGHNQLPRIIRCNGREVVEGEEILDQTLDRLVVFDAPGLDESIEGHQRILLGLGNPNLL